MHFRHQDQDTKRKNISKLENRILEKGSLLHECCVNRYLRIVEGTFIAKDINEK